ncbi:MAG: SHOCT domain-containing protein [Desulfitobacteriaceae bacterium]
MYFKQQEKHRLKNRNNYNYTINLLFQGLVQWASPFIFERRNKLINENKINYQMSLHILKMLMRKNLITEQEFTAINNENRKSFKVLDIT